MPRAVQDQLESIIQWTNLPNDFQFTPFQIEAFVRLHRGEDLLACVHTGAGKFLIVAFAVWFCGGGVELIATPLDQLAREHAQTLIDLGVPPADVKIVNTKNLVEVIAFVRGVSVGSAPVYVIGHPEVLLDLVAADDLKRNKSISVAVLDEAELAVDWESFRAAWAQCRRLREQNDTVRWVGCTGSSSFKGRIQIANNVGIHVS